MSPLRVSRESDEAALKNMVRLLFQSTNLPEFQFIQGGVVRPYPRQVALPKVGSLPQTVSAFNDTSFRRSYLHVLTTSISRSQS
jgi:hypothetical protein